MKRRRFIASSGALMAAAGSGIAAVTRAGAAARSSEARDADVLVIGAGLSGLYASMLLEEQGLKVCVLEGRDRVGGRMFTLDKLPGRPEGGGSLLGPRYARALDLAARLKVKLAPARPRTEPIKGEVALNIRGRTIRVEDWAASPMNTFPEPLRHLTPWDVYFGELLKLNPFENLGDWRDPRFAAYDRPVQSILLERGFDPEALRILQSNSSYGNDFFTLTALHLYHYFTWQKLQAVEGPRVNCADGNQRLPEAMARRLTGDLLKGQRVVAITLNGDGAEVHCEDGARHRAKAVVSSMPFATLRNVRIDPLPPPAQNTAIRTLGYVPMTQVHVVPKAKFWEQDGLNPSMWTDGITGTVYAQRFGPDPDEVMSITAWARGLNARYLDRLGAKGAGAAIVAELERLRPAAKGKLKVAKVQSWAMDPFAGGVWSTFEPGQVTAFAGEMANPHGRLFFCGEHTALASRGMEGALESAERAAVEVQLAVG